MHAGTAVGTFVRENLVNNKSCMSFYCCSLIFVSFCLFFIVILVSLHKLDCFGAYTNYQDLLRKRGNWAQFSAIAGLGVIYRDNREQLQLQQGESQMSPYVFESPSGVSCIAYTKGGALCAVDLYYANHGEEIKQCIRDSLRSTNVEVCLLLYVYYIFILEPKRKVIIILMQVVKHGACLGLGLAALGTAGENIYDDIKNVLHADSAVAGEAAGLQAICLLVLVRHNMRRLLGKSNIHIL